MRKWIVYSFELAVVYGLLGWAVAGTLARGDEPAQGRSDVVDPASADSSGFTGRLNARRAERGLAPVAHDSGLSTHARRNNELQSRYGLGHHYTGGLAQCAGVGLADCVSALAAWIASPGKYDRWGNYIMGHADILFSPTLVAVGFDQLGSCVTVSCSMGGASVAASGAGTISPPSSMPAYRVRPRRRMRLCR